MSTALVIWRPREMVHASVIESRQQTGSCFVGDNDLKPISTTWRTTWDQIGRRRSSWHLEWASTSREQRQVINVDEENRRPPEKLMRFEEGIDMGSVNKNEEEEARGDDLDYDREMDDEWDKNRMEDLNLLEILVHPSGVKKWGERETGLPPIFEQAGEPVCVDAGEQIGDSTFSVANLKLHQLRCLKLDTLGYAASSSRADDQEEKHHASHLERFSHVETRDGGNAKTVGDGIGRTATAGCVKNQDLEGHPRRFRNLHTNRPLTDADPEIVTSWFKQSHITLGRCAGTTSQRMLIMRLCYTFKDCFVSKLEDIRTTDLLHHHIGIFR
ncbi:hypothetical protein E4U09_001037 [Claviceps aff. purpurea]|uniref:Uncharacterized protein n=1 Tax=Claviceps aff. purpurea TaxID=1967640 RepID=A0A9P7QI62_9HYPO|nr:hypothetical protein E4U09_001037 [Claviceps aff. purpurea]